MMLDIKYVYKREEIGSNSYKYIYDDCFTDDQKVLYCDENDIFADVSFEAKYKLICSGDYVNAHTLKTHIIRMLRPRQDNMEFTDVNVLLLVDGVMSCNIDLSTKYLLVSDIEQFIHTLMTSTKDTGETDLQLTFTRPDIDINFFTIKVQDY